MQFQIMNISFLHMYRVYLPLYQNCIDRVVLISLNVMWNIRNEVDKTFVRTKQIDCLICDISIRIHGVLCSSILGEIIDIFASAPKITS